MTERTEVKTMRGPLMLLVAIVALFGASIGIIELSSGTEVASGAAPGSAAPSAALPPSPGRRAAPAPAAGVELDPRPGLDLTPPVLQASTSLDRERKLNDCVERNVHGAGYDDVKPTLPGRWPALKRARESRRLRRLEVRAECEQKLAEG